MASRGGGGGMRDRFRSSNYSRFEESNSNINNFTGSNNTNIRRNSSSDNPPSRHLWVGNLPHSIIESDLTDHFLRFGELDSVAFLPGRSYAFVNFKNDEDAIAALKSLQGFPLVGNPLRIEFAKADKSSAPSRDEDYLQRRDEPRSTPRGLPIYQRDSRLRSASPEPVYADKSKTNDKSTEPSEVLWIGFPALLKVDEMILRKAFSPFGEIEKITAFPGRSYAFVRFRNLVSACRAKETLQGKLFGNPRVHICFARNEGGSSGSARAPISPQFRSNGYLGASENFRQDRNFGSLAPDSRSPLVSNLDSDSDAYGFNRKRMLHPGGNNTFDSWRFGEEPGPPLDVYDRRGSPTRERDPHFDEFPQKASYYEEPWDLSEDSHLHGAKKLKTKSFPPEKELPEYPFSDLEQERRAFPRGFSDFPQHEVLDKNYGYKTNSDFHPSTFSMPHGERRTSYDNFQPISGAIASNPVERRRFSPEPERRPLKLWKWEGTIAKGGTPVCRAQAFPVGKALDIMLPELLDCTARTGLDMLRKHYYQAASSWVVFFTPASDDDIGYYNEFMHYLGEKQRAAVAKLDDNTTLFLVPPSDFSEKVLRVPGKLSISGVILRLEPLQPDSGPYNPNEKRGANLSAYHGDAPSAPSHFPLMPPFSDIGRPGGDPSFPWDMATSGAPSFSGSGRISNSYNDDRQEYANQQRSPGPGNWSPHTQNSFSSNRNIPSQAYNPTVHQGAQEYHSAIPRGVPEDGFNHPTSGRQPLQENKPSVSSSLLPIAGLPPQQLAQLALVGQLRASMSNSNGSLREDIQQTNAVNQSGNQFTNGVRNNSMASDVSPPQYGHLHQQQASNVPKSMPTPVQSESSQGSNAQEGDGDPQKRLQATLQLAAALLQQIQHGKGT